MAKKVIKLNSKYLIKLFEIFIANDFDRLMVFIDEYGLNAIDNDGNNIFLHSITDESFFKLSEKIIEQVEGFDINFQNKTGVSALHFAVKYKNMKLIELLLKNKKINVNLKDINEDTPLSIALLLFDKKVEEDIIIKLLDAGADINIFDKYGYRLNEYINVSMNRVNKYIKESNIKIIKSR